MLQTRMSGGGISAGPPRRVFVSYSHTHADAAIVREFILQFSLVKARLELEVFFDEKRIAPGAEWEREIKQHVMACDIFLFFISPESVNSINCRNELLGALDREKLGLCTIVPILITDCSWEKIPLPDGTGRIFSKLTTLPRSLKALRRFQAAERGLVWKSVVEDLEAMVTGVFATIAAPSATAANASQSPFETLPYYCDQHRTQQQVRDGLRSWNGEGVIIVLRADREDCPDKFIERIKRREISPRLREFAPDQPIVPAGIAWPAEPFRKDAQYHDHFREQLGERLFDERSFMSQADLLRNLAEKKSNYLIAAGLPQISESSHRAAILGLASFLKTVKGQIGSTRIVFVLWTEHQSAKPLKVTQAWASSNAPTGEVLVPEPLGPFDGNQIRIWALDDRVRCHLDADALDQLLKQQEQEGRTTFRMREFAKLVTPLLAQQ